MQIQYKPVVAFDLLGCAVKHFFLLRFVGSKQMIKKHDHAPVIFVNVLRVAAVVNPMIGWCIEQPLNGRVKFPDRLGVHKPLVGQVGCQ